MFNTKHLLNFILKITLLRTHAVFTEWLYKLLKPFPGIGVILTLFNLQFDDVIENSSPASIFLMTGGYNSCNQQIWDSHYDGRWFGDTVSTPAVSQWSIMLQFWLVFLPCCCLSTSAGPLSMSSSVVYTGLWAALWYRCLTVVLATPLRHIDPAAAGGEYQGWHCSTVTLSFLVGQTSVIQGQDQDHLHTRMNGLHEGQQAYIRWTQCPG